MPINTNKTCQPTNTSGLICTFTCQNGFYFYDEYPNNEFIAICEPGQEFQPQYFPSCSGKIKCLCPFILSFLISIWVKSEICFALFCSFYVFVLFCSVLFCCCFFFKFGLFCCILKCHCYLICFLICIFSLLFHFTAHRYS